MRFEEVKIILVKSKKNIKFDDDKLLPFMMILLFIGGILMGILIGLYITQ